MIGDVMAAVGLRKSMAIAVFKDNMTFARLSDPHPQQIHNIYRSIVKQECRSNIGFINEINSLIIMYLISGFPAVSDAIDFI
mgnify:CR=1 FL=1